MGNSDGSKPSSNTAAGSPAKPATGTTPTANPPSLPAAGTEGKAGRIVHDERGNAVWDWVVETGRIFIGSTSRLLKRLEAPELHVEEEGSQELRLESARDEGGGYDPYGRPNSGRATGSYPRGINTAASAGKPFPGGTKPVAGGSYDPASKGTPRKPGRKI